MCSRTQFYFQYYQPKDSIFKPPFKCPVFICFKTAYAANDILDHFQLGKIEHWFPKFLTVTSACLGQPYMSCALRSDRTNCTKERGSRKLKQQTPNLPGLINSRDYNDSVAVFMAHLYTKINAHTHQQQIVCPLCGIKNYTLCHFFPEG